MTDTLTSTQTLLLAAVRAAPDADLPRLAYADYLEEAAKKEARAARPPRTRKAKKKRSD